jgi:hypothetical protein
MNKEQTIAERILFLVNSIDGSREKVVFKIGHPYWLVPNKVAACLVVIEGEKDFSKKHKLSDSNGVDFLQAVEHAISILNNFFENLPENYTAYWDAECLYELGEISSDDAL